MHLARLLDFHHHDAWVKYLMREYQREAFPFHKKVSLDQIMLADQELFVRLAEETRSGLGPNPIDNSFPLDALLPHIMHEPRITSLLNPLQLSSGHQHVAASGNKRTAEVDKLHQEIKKLRANAKGSGRETTGNVNARGAKQKGKGRSGEGFTKMPKELIGLPPRLDGEAICFSFNLAKGCMSSLDGNNACSRGKHVCMRCGSTGHGASSSRCEKRR